ncbi:MAG: glycosyltransferase family 2 protein, partial [Candidatus Omnitrophica bacterium]|nr:glycosyltransferase family 2 protein [Candidatus Omnitrophota bacterium]
MPAVSVIMPTYNRVSYLRGAIESVLAQTFRDWELVVVVDGSKDGSKELVESYARSDGRVICIWQGNAGYSAANNRGLREAKGLYIAFLDDDDRWLPEKLELQVNLMKSSPEAGFCYGRFRVFRQTDHGLREGKLFPQKMITKFEELSDAFVPPSATLIRKSLIDEVGGFDP